METGDHWQLLRKSPWGVAVVSVWVALFALGFATPALAIDLQSSGGFLFDIDDSNSGTLGNGTRDAYDGCYRLEVNGTTYSARAPGELDGRTVRMAKVPLGELQVQRMVTVPQEQGRDYARYVDVIENNGSAAVTVTVRYTGNLGSDSSTTVWATSSDDLVVSSDDLWFGTDDVDSGGDPSLAHVFFGAGASVTPTQMSLTSDNIAVTFSVEIAPHRSAAFMFFAFQGPNQATVREQVELLIDDVGAACTDLPPGMFAFMSNWSSFGAIGLANVYLPDDLEPLDRRPRVYEGTLHLAVQDVEAERARIVEVAEELGGHLQLQGEDMVTVLVPIDEFDAAMERIEALGDVESRSVRIERGNESVRDIQTRLQTARDVLARLTEMHGDAQSTTDALVIQREIERIHLIIESLEAELRDLERRTRYSVINVHLRPLVVYEPIPNDLFRLPFSWLDELGLDNLLNVN